jgi:PAS domain-containing protein
MQQATLLSSGSAAGSQGATELLRELSRADMPRDMTGPQLLNMRRKKGVLDVSNDDFYSRAAGPQGLVTELPDGRSVLVKYFILPNGGSVATHLDCTEQRKLSRKLSSTTQFLESVLDNVPVCVAAKSIEDGRYIFANRAFERFSRFSRDTIVGSRAGEIFKPATAASVEAADQAAHLQRAQSAKRIEVVSPFRNPLKSTGQSPMLPPSSAVPVLNGVVPLGGGLSAGKNTCHCSPGDKP